MLPNSFHRKQKGLSNLIFGDSDAAKARHKQENAQDAQAARLDEQEKVQAAKDRSTTEQINARRRASFGRTGRTALLTGNETGVGGGGATPSVQKSDTLG